MGAMQPLGQMVIELGLDSANFASGMKGAEQRIKSSMIEMKAHLNIMGRSGKEIDALSAKQSGLTKVIAAQNVKVSLAKETYDACRAAVEKNTGSGQENKDALIKARNEYVKAIGELGSYENQLKDVTVRLTAMESSLYQTGTAMVSLGTSLTKVGDTASKVGSALTAGIAMPVLAIGAYAVKTTADFDKSMSQVSAVSGAVGEDFSQLREKAREMGEKTKFSAKEAADAMNYMAMAGWKTGDMLDGVEGIMNLAAASGEDLAITSDIVTDALTGFGKSAADSGRLADIMAAASSNSNTNVSMMGETFKYCTPIAGALGFSMEDTAEAIGLMANSGIKASMAGTSMRSIMNNLSSDVTLTGDSFGKLMVRTQESDGSMRELNEILADCRSGFSTMTDAEKVANAEAIVGRNAMSGFLALMNAAPADIEKLNDAIANSDGAAKAMAETMQDNLAGQLVILKSQTDELAISFGDILVPKVREIVSGIQGAVDSFNQMDEGTRELIVNVGLFAATVGPAVLVVGKLTSGIGAAVSTIGKGMNSFALWAAELTHTTTATAAQTAATVSSTAATQANTGVTAGNTAGLMAKTAKTIADTVATKAHEAAEKIKNVTIAAGNGTLTAQAAALNASILSNIKNTAATAAHTVAEKARGLAMGMSTTGFTVQTVAIVAQTVATNACAVGIGVLSAALKLLLGPVGWIIAGITALVAGVVAVVKWLNKETEASKQLTAETEELAKANDSLVESMGTSSSMYDDNVKAIKSEAGAAKTLTDKIAELSKIENKSASQKKELQLYVGMLNQSMEGLNLQYDAQSDALSMATEEVYAQITALEKQAQTQAAQERMTEILKEQITAGEQLTLVQEKITEVTENDSLKNAERKTILEDLTGQEAALQEQLSSLGDSYAYVTDIVVQSAQAESEAVTENTQTILEAYQSIGGAYEDLGERQKQAIDGITNSYEVMSGKLSDLTEQIKLDNETTWEEIQKNQEDTIAKTEEFSQLYAELMQAGISESYLNAIGATGPESIPLLKDMISKGTDTVLQSQSDWQEAYGVIGNTLVDSLELDDTVGGALKEYILGESGVYGTLKGAVAEADLNALGKSITEGVSKGILDNTDGLETSVTGMASDTTDAAEEAWGIHSPSRVFAEIGKNLMRGLVQGISSHEGAVYAKAESVANKVTATVKQALDIHSPSRVMRDEVGKNIAIGIAEGITQNADYAKKSAEEIASAILQSAKTKLDNTKVYTELTLADEAAYWDQVRKQVTDGTQAKIDADKQYFQAKQSLNQKMASLEQAYADNTKKIYSDLDKNIQAAQDAYTNKLTSKTQSIAGSMGLFNKFTAETKLSTADLLGNLKSQVNGLQDWSKNLKELENRGISGDMLEELRGMGTSAAGEIALLTELTDEELDEYISLWKQKQRLARKEAKKELAPILEETEEQIAQMRITASKGLDEYKNEYVSAMTEIGVQMQTPLSQLQTALTNTMANVIQMVAGTVSDEADKPSNVSQFKGLAESVKLASQSLPTDFTSIGQDTISGMIHGLQNKTGSLYQTMSEIVRGAIQTAKDEAQIHSPSKVMMSLGSYMMEGFGIGMEQMQGYVNGISSMSVGKAVDKYRAGIETYSRHGGISSRLPELQYALTDKNGVMQSIGKALHTLRMQQDGETVSKEPDKNEGMMNQLLDTNNQMVKLLQVIADKNLNIDKKSMTEAVSGESGVMKFTKVRFT